MIKTKEDLLNTFIRNDGELAEKWVSIVGCRGLAAYHDSFYLAINQRQCVSYMPELDVFGGCGGDWLADNGYREITLADFEPEVTPEEEVVSEPKYKYEKLITDSITELFGLFYEGKLYSGITGHKQIKTIEGLLASHRDEDIYTREEVKWQDEVTIYAGDNKVNYLGYIISKYPDHFLEAARIALKSTGELS